MKRLISCAWVACAACQFDGRVPDASFICDVDADCPSALVCQRSTRRCITPLGLGDVAISAASLQYHPAASNRLSVVTAARADTRVQIDVTFNQPVTCNALDATPPDLITFGMLTAQGTACRFSGVPLVTAEGDWNPTLEVVVTDGLGEPHTLTVVPSPALRIDTRPPSPPDVDTDGGVVYLRAPYGSALAPANQVTGGPASVEPGAGVLVFDLAPTGAVEVQHGTADPSGAFGPLRVTADPVRIAVAALDEAGNASAMASVHEVVWVATHDLREASAAAGNPHRLMVRQANTGARSQSFELEVSGDAGIARLDGERLEVTGGKGLWLRRGQELQPGGRFAAVFDARRARVIAIGGAPTATYAWDGTDWVQIVDGPDVGSSQLLATYDAKRDRIVVFAGIGGTWEFDGRSPWARVITDEVPDVRNHGHLGYDPQLREVVLVGGGAYFGSLPPMVFGPSDRSWSYDGQRWRRLAPSPTLGGREYERGVYDPYRHEHVLYGGTSTDTRVWTVAGASVRATVGPGPRREHCLVFDERLKKVLMLGGEVPTTFGAPSSTYDDVWAWDGAQWSQLYAGDGGSLQVGAQGAACAFDATHDEVVVGAGTNRSDTRAFKGDRLEVRAGPSVAAPSAGATLWADDRLVLITADAGTATWSNGVWSYLPDAGAPSAMSLAYDPQGQRMLGLPVGGAALWTFDSTRWAPLVATPAPSGNAALFYDVAASQAIVDAAEYAAAYRGSTWFTLRDAGVSNHVVSQTVYSPAHDALVRLSGVRSTERWNGSGWAVLDGGTLVQATTSAQTKRLATDFVDGRVFMVAGSFAGDRPPLTALTAAGWGVVEALNVGPNGHLAEPAYDRQNRRLWVHERPFTGATRVWELALGELRPAIVSHFVLPDLASATVTSMSVSAVAGGTGGARARVWYRARWADPSSSSSAQNASPASQPSPLSLTITDPAQLYDLLNLDAEVTTELEPVVENGAGASLIGVDHVELTVRYRLP